MPAGSGPFGLRWHLNSMTLQVHIRSEIRRNHDIGRATRRGLHARGFILLHARLEKEGLNNASKLCGNGKAE